LNIPIAVIADLDMIADPNKLRSVLEVMAHPDVAHSLTRDASSVMTEIRKLPPTIDPEEIKNGLRAITSSPLEWRNEDDIKIRRELNRMAQQLNRMRQLKRGGIYAFPENIAHTLKQLISALKKVGIFLVPVGELEEWLAGENINESKANKWAWANAASLCIQSKGASDGDIWDFVRSVGTYLRG
jgi:hypothetical protein